MDDNEELVNSDREEYSSESESQSSESSRSRSRRRSRTRSRSASRGRRSKRSRRRRKRRGRSRDGDSSSEDEHTRDQPEETADTSVSRSQGQAPSQPPQPQQQGASSSKSAKVLLCSDHGNNLLPDTCNACRCVSRLVGPDMARQLVVHGGLPSTSSIPSPAKRLLGKRSDEVEPTLVFCEEELEVADKMFSMGRFRKGHFEEVVKDHLMCPKPQHQRLTQNLVLEKALRDLDRGKGFGPVRNFRDSLIKFGWTFERPSVPLFLRLV